MKWNKKNAYLQGYTELSYYDKLIANTKEFTKWNADWEKQGSKPLDNDSTTNEPKTGPLLHDGKMYTMVDNNFKYSSSIYGWYDDPTYLGYTILIDTESSPLWNYGNSRGETTSLKSGSVLGFITKYSDIYEIRQRGVIYQEFLAEFEEIIGTTLSYVPLVKSYYVEQISGLDKLMSKIVKYPDDKLTITLTENVSLRATYLAELYNNLCYSYNYQRFAVPDNTLRFDLLIQISDIRVFKSYSDDGKPIINTSPPKMVFRLHDCNFDFSQTKPFTESISMAGFSAVDKTPRNLTFDIIYKSITREFSSTLFPAYDIINKANQLLDNEYLSNKKYFEYQQTRIYPFEDNRPNTINEETPINQQQQSSIEVNPTESIIRERENLIGDKLDFEKGFGASLQQVALDNVEDYVDKLLDRFSQIRGTLLKEILRHIREPFNMPRIYPDNVYSADFRTLSLQNFLTGLGSDSLNLGEDFINDTVNDVGLDLNQNIKDNLFGGIFG